MKLQYFLYFVIGSVVSDLAENWKNSQVTLQKHPKRYGLSSKKEKHYDGGNNTFQSTFEDIDNITARIPATAEIVQNITEQINSFQRTEEKKSPFDIRPLFFISNPTDKLQETANVYPNHNAQKHTPTDVNYEVQELVQVYPNRDLQEHEESDHKQVGQKQVFIGPTSNLRRLIQLGFFHRSHRGKINFLQRLLKTYNQSPVQLHGKQNTWEFTELDSNRSTLFDHRELLLSGITHDHAKSLQLHRDSNPQKTAANLANEFPKLVKLKSMLNNHIHEENRNNAIKSKEILNFQEPEVRVLGMPGDGNLTDSLRNAYHLIIFHNPKKREIFSKVNKHDATQRFHNTKHPINTDQANKDDSGTLNEVDLARDVRIYRDREPNDSVQFTPNTIRKELAEFIEASLQRNKTRVFPRHILSKTINNNQDYLVPTPVQVEKSHNMRQPVQLNPIHNMREPVKLHPTHNLQKSVQLDPTHDMRKPVDLHTSHDLRYPVKLEPTHNLRKTVKPMESHDLRWPVVEESDHNMRDNLTEADIFRSGDAGGKLKEFMKGQLYKGSKTSYIDDPLHELLYEDEFLFLKCSRDEANFNHTTFSIGTNPANATTRPVTKYNNLFNESIKACGISFNHSRGNLRRERKLTKWPWMVSLQQYTFNRFWHKCAGSLLNNLWVITAAHCVDSRPKWDFLLQLGMNEDSQNYIERFVDRMSIHPKFNSLSLDHDIVLLRMDGPVAFQAGVIPICLPWKHDEIEKKKAVALSWRLDNKINGSDDSSQEKTVPVLTNKECEVMFSETGSSESIQKSFLCASFGNRDPDSCGGDSGGPLVIFDENGRWILAGIYSWGKSCRTPNQPEVYIRISRYSEWIEKTVMCYEGNINLLGMD